MSPLAVRPTRSDDSLIDGVIDRMTYNVVFSVSEHGCWSKILQRDIDVFVP